MCSKKIINKNYLAYTLRRSLPCFGLMTVAMILVSFCAYTFSTAWDVNKINILTAEDMSFSTYPFAFIFPVIFAITVFSYLHKKTASDFFGSVPVSRRQLFLSNFLVAVIGFTAMIILNFSMIMFIFFVARPGLFPVLAFGEVVRFLVFNLLAFLLAYSGSALAATLTGNIPSQLLLSYVILIVPSLLLQWIQILPRMTTYDNLDVIWRVTLDADPGSYGTPLSRTVLFLPNLISAPFQSIGIQFTDSVLAGFQGVTAPYTGYLSAVYNVIVIAVYNLLGVLFFRRYKFEKAGTPFVNVWAEALAKGGSFGMAFLLFRYLIKEGLDNATGITLTVVLFIGYIIVDLILNKGFGRIKRSAVILASTVAVTVAFGFGADLITESTATKLSAGDIKKMTVYLQPINAQPYSRSMYGTESTLVPLEIRDQSVIGSLLSDGSGAEILNDRLTVKLQSRNGREYVIKLRLSEASLRRIAGLAAEDTVVREKMLVTAPGIADYISTAYSVNIRIRTPALQKESEAIAARYSSFNKEELTQVFLSWFFSGNYDLTGETSYSNRFCIRNDVLYADGFLPEDSLESIPCIRVRYVGGRYTKESMTVSSDTIFNTAENLIFADEAAIGKAHINNDAEIMYVTRYGENGIQPLGIVGNLQNIKQSCPELFREILISGSKNPRTADNSIVLYVKDLEGFVLLDIDRDILPVMEKFAETMLRGEFSAEFAAYFPSARMATSIGSRLNGQEIADLIRRDMDSTYLEVLKKAFCTKFDSAENEIIPLLEIIAPYRIGKKTERLTFYIPIPEQAKELRAEFDDILNSIKDAVLSSKADYVTVSNDKYFDTELEIHDAEITDKLTESLVACNCIGYSSVAGYDEAFVTFIGGNGEVLTAGWLYIPPSLMQQIMTFASGTGKMISPAE